MAVKPPFISITHNLTNGTITTSIAPGISDDDMEKVGYLMRVAMFNFADVLSGGLVHLDAGEPDEPSHTHAPTHTAKEEEPYKGPAYR